MIICGVKITHDGGVALIDNGRLVFSIEMEKIGNNPRHQRVDDLDVVTSLLGQYGYTLGQVDRFVLDGWRKTPGQGCGEVRRSASTWVPIGAEFWTTTCCGPTTSA